MTTTTTLQDHVLDELAAEINVDVEVDNGAVIVLPRYRDDLDRIAARVDAPDRLVVCVRMARWAERTEHGWVVFIQPAG